LASLIQLRKWNDWALWKFWNWHDLSFYTYLALTTALVTTSWLGWSRSVQAAPRVQNVFTWLFVMLLIDLALVICYFVIANNVGIRRHGDTPATRSATKETVGIMVVFFGYLVWDIVTHGPRDYLAHWERLENLVYARATLLCFGLAGLSWAALRKINGNKPVVFVDLALLCLVFLFRALKEKEWPWLVALSVGYVACFVLAKVYDHNPETKRGSAEPEGPVALSPAGPMPGT
jgi:hypothetical protein